MVGYSRLMGRDEADSRTLARTRSKRLEPYPHAMAVGWSN